MSADSTIFAAGICRISLGLELLKNEESNEFIEDFAHSCRNSSVDNLQDVIP